MTTLAEFQELNNRTDAFDLSMQRLIYDVIDPLCDRYSVFGRDRSDARCGRVHANWPADLRDATEHYASLHQERHLLTIEWREAMGALDLRTLFSLREEALRAAPPNGVLQWHFEQRIKDIFEKIARNIGKYAPAMAAYYENPDASPLFMRHFREKSRQKFVRLIEDLQGYIALSGLTALEEELRRLREINRMLKDYANRRQHALLMSRHERSNAPIGNLDASLLHHIMTLSHR